MYFQIVTREKLIWFLSVLAIVRSGEDSPDLLEESFVEKFGNDVMHFDTWQMMREWYYKGGVEALRRFCQAAHKEAGMGEVKVSAMITYPRTLNFKNKKYLPMRIDVVRYEIEESGVDDHGENPFFVTRGRKPNCVYYLTQWQTDPHRFYLTKHVCSDLSQ